MESNGRSMNLFSRLKHEWKNAGIIERASWVIGLIGFGATIMGVIVWSYEIIENQIFFYYYLLYSSFYLWLSFS